MRPDTHQQKHAEGRGRARRRTLLRVAAGVLLYVLGGALLHYVVAPEAAPPQENAERQPQYQGHEQGRTTDRQCACRDGDDLHDTEFCHDSGSARRGRKSGRP